MELLESYEVSFSSFQNVMRFNVTNFSFSCPSDERESVQKKTFQKWVNSHLVRVGNRIGDLYTDLRDGKMLLKLLEVLSGERLV